MEHIGTQERLHLILTGEEKLQRAFGKTEMSGNSLCRSVCRCIGWLHYPTLKPLHLSTQEFIETRGLAAKPCNCQQRVRKLMFSLPNMLDLQDALPYEKLESALTYVRHWLLRFIQVWVLKIPQALTDNGDDFDSFLCLIPWSQTKPLTT